MFITSYLRGRVDPTALRVDSGAISRFIEALSLRLERARIRRSLSRELNSLSNRELDDIGIRRVDIPMHADNYAKSRV